MVRNEVNSSCFAKLAALLHLFILYVLGFSTCHQLILVFSHAVNAFNIES